MRGIIHDPRGIQIVKYAWGHGNVCNNIYESYSLCCALIISKEEGIKKMIVLGDSLMVRQAVNDMGSSSDKKFSLIIRSTKRLTQHFDQIQLFDIKRRLNVEVDLWEMLSMKLHQGSFKKK